MEGAQTLELPIQMPDTEEPAVIIPIGYSAVAETPTKTRKAPQELFFEE